MDPLQRKENRIMEILRQGEKPAEAFQVGVELEHIVVNQETGKSVSYDQPHGIRDILKQMVDEQHQPVMEKDFLIGLKHADYAITLEPGGQVEISIKPCYETEEVLNIYGGFLNKILPIVSSQGQWLLCIGYHPVSSIQDIPFNPKQRYAYMSEYLIQYGRYAHHMMKGTASLQVVLDYESEEDFTQKFRVAHFLMPLLALLTDNAPFFEGKAAAHPSIRTAIWDETDPARCGLIPGVMDKVFGYRDYARYILRTCPILLKEEDGFKGFKDKTAGEIQGFEDLTDAEVDHILSMVFPDVRARQYIEIRMADSIPYPYNFGFIALIKGIFYQKEALSYLYRLSLGMSDAKLAHGRQQVMEKGYDGKFMGQSYGEALMMIFDLARRGLKEEEQKWLSHLESLVIRKETLASIEKERARQNSKWMQCLRADHGFEEESS